MDVITMSSVVQHGLIQRDRIFTVSVLLPDRPGELVRVASIIAEQQGNVIRLDHQPKRRSRADDHDGSVRNRTQKQDHQNPRRTRLHPGIQNGEPVIF